MKTGRTCNVAIISSYRLAHTDSLMSAFKPRGAPARWNSDGVVMVYTSAHLALAALEILNYWEEYSSLNGYFAYASHFDESLVQTATLEREDALDKSKARAYGDHWIASRSSVVLRVPSVTIQTGMNYLLNSNHPDFYQAVKLEALGSFSFDARVTALLTQAKRTS